MAARQRGEPVDHERRALLVGLHRQAEALPAGERRGREDALEEIERQVQPVGLLGVEGQADAAVARALGERLDAGASSASTRSRCANS